MRKKMIVLGVLGVALVILWQACLPRARVLTAVSCTPLSAATYATQYYVLRMDDARHFFDPTDPPVAGIFHYGSIYILFMWRPRSKYSRSASTDADISY